MLIDFPFFSFLNWEKGVERVIAKDLFRNESFFHWNPLINFWYVNCHIEEEVVVEGVEWAGKRTWKLVIVEKIYSWWMALL